MLACRDATNTGRHTLSDPIKPDPIKPNPAIMSVSKPVQRTAAPKPPRKYRVITAGLGRWVYNEVINEADLIDAANIERLLGAGAIVTYVEPVPEEDSDDE